MCLSAFTGGVASGFVCSPLELVMIQQQNFGGTLRATPSLVIKEFGVSKLFSRGLLMSCGREGIYTMGMLGVGPTVKRYGKEGLGMEVRGTERTRPPSEARICRRTERIDEMMANDDR